MYYINLKGKYPGLCLGIAETAHDRSSYLDDSTLASLTTSSVCSHDDGESFVASVHGEPHHISLSPIPKTADDSSTDDESVGYEQMESTLLQPEMSLLTTVSDMSTPCLNKEGEEKLSTSDVTEGI